MYGFLPDKPDSFIDCIPRKYLTPEELQKRLAEVLSPAEDYHVTSEEEGPRHQWGVGGHWIRRTSLVRANVPVLRSVHYSSYYTYSDDSFDFNTPAVEVTYLLSDDPIARVLFQKLRG